MSKRMDDGVQAENWVCWIARIWGAVIVVLVLLVFISAVWNLVTTGTFDPYRTENYPPIENLPPLFSFLSALGLIIAWRWEGVGGAIAVIFQLATLPVLLIHWPITEDFPRYLAPYGVWLLIFIPGVLFLWCWWKKRNASTQGT